MGQAVTLGAGAVGEGEVDEPAHAIGLHGTPGPQHDGGCERDACACGMIPVMANRTAICLAERRCRSGDQSGPTRETTVNTDRVHMVMGSSVLHGLVCGPVACSPIVHSFRTR